MGLAEEIRFAIKVSNPSMREVGGNTFPPITHSGTDTRLRDLEYAVAALANALDSLAQRVEQIQGQEQ